ncbi:MAG: 50S ribosomal protein L4 [Mycoplasmataceae bacterium]|jgi:large subunit ribosomal protein L4|nr:50S ribosomal protein L4 [Mycoplasmataceae bacterium]
MKNVKLINLNSKEVSQVELNSPLFLEKPNKQAMYDQVIAENSGRRQGTHSTLTRAEVRGGGKKVIAQKHSGRAQHGSIREPEMPGGGIVFGPKPNRNYKKGVNKQVSRLAMMSAFSYRLNNDGLLLLTDGDFSKPLTKDVVALLKAAELYGKKVLIVTDLESQNLIKSSNNIVRVEAKKYNQVSVKDVLNANYVVIQQNALELLAKAVNPSELPAKEAPEAKKAKVSAPKAEPKKAPTKKAEPKKEAAKKSEKPKIHVSKLDASLEDVVSDKSKKVAKLAKQKEPIEIVGKTDDNDYVLADGKQLPREEVVREIDEEINEFFVGKESNLLVTVHPKEDIVDYVRTKPNSKDSDNLSNLAEKESKK